MTANKPPVLAAIEALDKSRSMIKFHVGGGACIDMDGELTNATDLYSDMIKALADLQKWVDDNGWQPIETAPEGEKDGVLLWEPSFYQGRGGLAIGAYTKEYGWLCNGGKGSEATHWRPPLEPPMKGG